MFTSYQWGSKKIVFWIDHSIIVTVFLFLEFSLYTKYCVRRFACSLSLDFSATLQGIFNICISDEETS